MSISVKKITEPLLLGEGPHWDDKQQALLFVSIEEKTIHKYVLATGAHTKTQLDGRAAFIIPVDGATNQYLVGIEHKFLIIQWDGEEGSKVKILKELGEVDQHDPTTKINDGKADPKGRVYTGTMGRENPPGQYENGKGSMYRLDGRGVVKIGDGIGVANGLAWDLKEKAFYYVDSLERNIRRYDYDADTGEISNKRHIFDLEEKNIPGIPDGMALDTDGNLWVAIYLGSRVLKIDPRTGNLLQELQMPVEQVTSVAFGGPNLDILFVTTAKMPIGGEQKPPRGSTFIVTGLGVKGLPSVNFKLP